MKRRSYLSFLGGACALALLAAGTSLPVKAQTAAAPPPPMVAAPSSTPTSDPTASPANAALASEDIHDIRGPKSIPSPELWLLWIADSAALAALAYGAWRWYRHVSMTPRLPHEIALDRLEKARALLKVETAREFSIEVSEIIRSYIEARFHVRAAHQTTEEFLHHLLEPSDALLAGHQELLADFLHHCDLAKFARWILSVEEMEQMHASARTFVLQTGQPAAKPALAPATPEPAHA